MKRTKEEYFKQRLSTFLSGAMLEAVIKDDAEVVEKLLELGADPNRIEDKDRATPLHFALTFNSQKSIPVLLAHGADINCRDREGSSSWDYAVANKQKKIIAIFNAFKQGK